MLKEEWIENYEGLYKIREDGTHKTKLSEDYANDLNISDGFMYYVNKSNQYNIYKANIDGKNSIKLKPPNVAAY